MPWAIEVYFRHFMYEPISYFVPQKGTILLKVLKVAIEQIWTMSYNSVIVHCTVTCFGSSCLIKCVSKVGMKISVIYVCTSPFSIFLQLLVPLNAINVFILFLSRIISCSYACRRSKKLIVNHR